MLEMHESTIPESYAGLYTFLLAPVLWERMGNVPPLVRLLRAYVEKGGEQIHSKIVSFVCMHVYYVFLFIAIII